jgi:hypothetical protein
MSFSFRGRTSVVPREGNISRQNTAEIVIAFVRPAQTNFPLRGSVAGYGGWQARYGQRSDGSYVAAIARGFVVVDHPQTRKWADGRNRRGLTRPNLVSHELGHAVGLDHVHDARQLMNDTLRDSTPAGFGRGDRTGLKKVGRPAGCLDASSTTNDLS